MAAGRLKELKRVERSLYSVRAGRGSRPLVGGVEFERGAMHLRNLLAECSSQVRTARIDRELHAHCLSSKSMLDFLRAFNLERRSRSCFVTSSLGMMSRC